jgi:hypothetical protein
VDNLDPAGGPIRKFAGTVAWREKHFMNQRF